MFSDTFTHFFYILGMTAYTDNVSKMEICEFLYASPLVPVPVGAEACHDMD
jgi:hypothetical protein